MKRYLIISRAPFFTAVITPLIFGTALAFKAVGQVDWLHFLLCLIGLVAAHAGANIFNDYYDSKLGADWNNPHRNQFSGGSPHIVEGLEKASTFFNFGVASLVVAFICGAILAWRVDGGFGPVAWLTLAGFGIGFFYTAPPLKLAYRTWGEVWIFLAFGPLPVVGVWYVLTGTMSWLPFAASIPLSLLITNIIFINEFPDYKSDRDAGKRNIVVRLGLAPSRYIYHAMALAAFGLIMFYSSGAILGSWCLIGLAGLPTALIAIKILHRSFDTPAALLPAQGLTIATHLLTGLLLSLGVAIGA